MRIVSLLPSATEVICALGLGKELVGVTHECDYPAGALAKPRVVESVFPNDCKDMTPGAVNDSIGATSEPWPLVAQLVRRASFDVLAAYTERTQLEPAGSTVIDRLTTLYSRVTFDAVLGKEVDRAGRSGQPLSI